MSKKLIALCLALCVALGGCYYRSGTDSGLYACVYRLSESGSGGALLIRDRVEYSEGENILDVMLQALNSQPEKTGVGRVFPEGVQALYCSIAEGAATVEMSRGYLELDEMDRRLCASALVLTFSTLDKVCSISIKCGGRICESGLTVESVQQADALFEDYERTAKLCVPAEEGTGLVMRSVTLSMDGQRGIEEMIVSEVLARLPVHTAQTQVLSAEISGGVCHVDLSEAFYGNEPADYAQGMQIIYSIVNSLCRLTGVDSVTLSVEGQPVGSYGGFRPAWPLAASEELIIH